MGATALIKPAVRWAIYIAAPLSLILMWQIAVSTHLLNQALFPAPSAIAVSFVQYAQSGELWASTWATVQRIVIGFLIGGIPGTMLGLAMGMNKWVRAYFTPVVALLYPIPKIAVLPLFYFIYGTGDAAKWAVIAFGTFFLMTINTEAGVRQIDRIYLDVARAYRIRPMSFYFRVLLPGALPNIFAGVKLSIGIAIVLAIAAEFNFTKVGLGFTIINAEQLLDIERLYAALVAVSLLGLMLSVGLDALERQLLPWKKNER
jgi:NitT/TauT family transport system permease protein